MRRAGDVRSAARAAWAAWLALGVACAPALTPAATGAGSAAPNASTAGTGTGERTGDSVRARPPRTAPAPRATRSAPAQPVVSATAPAVLREFRGVWVATVGNMDWPSKRTLSTAEQQAELLAILDRAAELRLNAVLFQVRPAGDAFYDSRIEPWSEYLTGTQGKAPEPFWDPLAFAIREAHARGLELHAWFNPYRARFVNAKSPAARNHIARTNPSLVKKYGPYQWMDPGEPAVRARTLRVVLDVVKRYDVDGIHLDDYFYPYPENDRRGRAMPFPDEQSFARYRRAGGRLSRADWRRENVNTLVRELYEGVHATKPWVRFGISPFGIWRPGYPSQVRGFDAYERLYADARKWLREGWVDYFTPQLYWSTTKAGQAYPVLLDWWAGENVRARHLWPGNFTSLAGKSGGSAFPLSDLVEQIRLTRMEPRASGNVHFSMTSFLRNQVGMNDTLVAGPYRHFALPPATPWLTAPPPPVTAARVVQAAAGPQLRLSAPGGQAPWQWLVRLRTDTAWVTMLIPGTTDRWPIPRELSATVATISALNRIGLEGAAVTVPIETGTSSNSTGRQR